MTATGEKRFLTMAPGFTEFEREIMGARTKNSLAAPRARGGLGGRKFILSKTQNLEIIRLYGEGPPVQQIADLFGVSRRTVYRVLEMAYSTSSVN